MFYCRAFFEIDWSGYWVLVTTKILAILRGAFVLRISSLDSFRAGFRDTATLGARVWIFTLGTCVVGRRGTAYILARCGGAIRLYDG